MNIDSSLSAKYSDAEGGVNSMEVSIFYDREYLGV